MEVKTIIEASGDTIPTKRTKVTPAAQILPDVSATIDSVRTSETSDSLVLLADPDSTSLENDDFNTIFSDEAWDNILTSMSRSMSDPLP